MESDLDAGHPAFSDLGLQHLTASDVIRRSTYSVGGQATAVKVQGDPDAGKNGIFFLYSDHLGSTSVMSYGYNLDGSLHAQAGQVVAGSDGRYLPFGGWRGTEPNAGLTDRGYTGHKSNNLGSNDIGLIYMNARFYAPGAARFLSADTLVPDPTSPQSYNRYGYGYNNPVKYSDPTGHCSIQPNLGIETCTTFDNLDEAQFFLAFINAYLYAIEYDYETTLGMLEQWAAGELLEDIGGIIGEKATKNELAGEIGSKLVSLMQEFDTVANEEGLKTLRRFRDDLTSAIDIMAGYDNDALINITILGQSTLSPFDSAYRYSGGEAYSIQVVHYLRSDGGLIVNSESTGFFHQAGGPFNGLTNNFANTMQEMMIQTIPENGGRVKMQTHFTSLTVTPTQIIKEHNFGWYYFVQER